MVCTPHAFGVFLHYYYTKGRELVKSLCGRRVLMQSSYDFTGTLAVVTGASGGIGGTIAETFAEAGADVALVYGSNRNGAEGHARAARAQGVRAASFSADLRHDDDVRGLFDAIKRELGRPRVLINCAGVYPVSSLAETDEQQWRTIVDANLTSAFLCTREFARLALPAVEAEEGKGAGGAAEGPEAADSGAAPRSPAVVNIASIDAARPFDGHAHYGAAKSGMLGLTRGAAVEYGPGMRINAVSPGLVGRPGIEQEWPEGVNAYRGAAPLQRIGAPEDVAAACLFLASDAAAWITGAELTVDGGLSVQSGW
jgi:NAD(P)-dependent dehydrogenase (short-subunit alcohol dehydrogenase family)